MLAKLTSKNQLTLPKEVLRLVPTAVYFDATVEGSTIVLRPVRLEPAFELDLIRDRIAALGLTEGDVQSATQDVRRAR